MLPKKLSSFSDWQLQKLITLLGMLIACQVIYIQHGWINDDSVLYFEMARLFSIGEWQQGITLFNWPFYPVLISALHQLTHLSIQTSAQILNILFFGITTFSFVSLIRLAGGNKNTILAGAFLLLCSSYIVGDILPMLLRDQGFWAMFLTSLVFFIKFYRNKKLSDGIFWQVCAIASILFRIEATSFLIGLPFILFLQNQYSFKKNLIDYLRLNLIPILTLLFIVSLLILVPNVHLSDFGRLQEVVTIFPKMLNDMTHMFQIKAEIMGDKVLGEYIHNYGMAGIIITLIAIVIFKIITLMSWPVLGIFLLGRSIHQTSSLLFEDMHKIFCWVVAIALINAFVIISSVFVLSGRYITALGFIILIYAAFQLSSLIESFKPDSSLKTWKKIFLIFMLSLVAMFGIKNLLPKPSGYIYEQNAVNYLKKQHIQNNEVFFVTPRSRYYAGAAYAGRGYDYWDYTKKAIDNGLIYQFNYLMINLDLDDKFENKQKILSEKLPQYKVVKEFYGYRNKKKIILYMKI